MVSFMSSDGCSGDASAWTKPEPDSVKYVVHGTTVATNAIIEGNLAKTAFITTEGFRDLLEIQTGIRPTLYDLQFHKLKPLVPRYLCFGVPERLGFQRRCAGCRWTKMRCDSVVRGVAR